LPFIEMKPARDSRTPWRAIGDPQQRLERALDELYAYYERTEPMLSNVLRDAELVDFAHDAVAPLHAYLEEAADNNSGEHCATPSPFRPGARCRPAASSDPTRRGSSPRSSTPLTASTRERRWGLRRRAQSRSRGRT
jgi:hypothetical protein